ncbi:MAG: hypothetical protein V5A83_03195 [Candidatus Bipolaricaulota bacterium]
MQTTIYYKEDDSYLIDKVEEKSNTERKSKSAVILSILENYFEAEKRVGEILKDLGVLKREHLTEALENQKDGKKGKLLGEIMLEEGYVKEIDLDRALKIQRN